jgi:hypothetical protein
MKTTIKIIKEGEKLPKGYKYLTTYKAEELRCNNPEVYSNLDILNGWFWCINPDGKKWAVWFDCSDSVFRVYGDDIFDNYIGRSRGVLVIKEDIREIFGDLVEE